MDIEYFIAKYIFCTREEWSKAAVSELKQISL